MRLIWLADYGGPYPGSGIPLLLSTLHTARDRGWHVACAFGPVASDRPWLEHLRTAEIPVSIAPKGFRRRTGWVRSLVAETDCPTVLHCTYSGFDAAAAVATLGQRRRGAVFWHVRTALNPSLRARVRNLLRFGILGRTIDGIFTPSTDLREQVIRRGAPSAAVRALPNGIDTRRFSLPDDTERERARKLLDLPAGATVLLHFGWDWTLKGGDLFLAAVQRILAARTADEPLIALTNQGGEVALQQARELGISGHVRVIGPRDDVEILHAAADVMLAPSRAEGGMPPLAVTEALSRGVAVVASDIAGHVVAAKATQACRVVPLDADAIATTTVEVLARKPSVKQREARQGHDWVAAERSIEAWADRMVNIYEEALDVPAQRSANRDDRYRP